MPKDIETEVAVLKEQTKTLHSDLSEMKGDIKEIKELLSSKFVTKEEFNNFKKSQTFQKMIIGVVTAIITAIISIELTKYIK